ncbi:MAG: HEPN domain-containing protein [Bryobacteraceae bacterium]|jgi:hypothetical protein
MVITLRWVAAAPAFLLNIQGRVRLNNEVVCDSLARDGISFGGSAAADLQRERPIPATLTAPLSAESIRWIEDQRATNDITIQVELKYAWQEALPLAGGTQIAAGRVYWDTADCHYRISRSDWLRILAELKWQEYEMFEIAALPLVADANLQQALQLLRHAQEALRSGDYAGALACCRRALESAAKYHVQGDNVKEGFNLLLQAAVPEHEDKRTALNGVMAKLSEYAHLGRHERYPALRITRAEAEFVVTATIALFSFLSRRLAKTETAD